MKTIESVPIWDNGTVQEAKILNTYAINVTLSTSATFYYQLFAETVDLTVTKTTINAILHPKTIPPRHPNMGMET
jgi:hypothetical protein